MFSKWGYETKIAMREMFDLYLNEGVEIMLQNHHGKVKYCRHCVVDNVRQILQSARKDHWAVYIGLTVCDCCGTDMRIVDVPEWNVEY